MGNQVLIIPVLITELLPLILSFWLTCRTQTSKGGPLCYYSFPPESISQYFLSLTMCPVLFSCAGSSSLQCVGSSLGVQFSPAEARGLL